MQKRYLILGFLVMLLCGARQASAVVIVDTLPEFSGEFHDAGESYPLAPMTIGTFIYDVPEGDVIDSGTLEGRFGNSQGGNTAPLDVLLNDLIVAQCAPGGSSCTQLPQEAFSFNFSKIQFQYLEQKPVNLRAVQTGPGTLRLGPTTLTIQTKPVPEPSTILLLGMGLLSLLSRRRICP